MNNTLVIKFFEPVDEYSTRSFMNIVDQAINQGVKNLIILLSTPGGSVFHGLSIYNYLKGLPLDNLITHNFGSVDSIGVVIYCAGKERYSSPQARFLMHGVSMNFMGQQTLEEPQLEEKLKSLKIDIENIAKVISVNTGKTEIEVTKAMLDRTTLNPEQAHSWGLVTGIKGELFTSGTPIISVIREHK